MGSNIFVQNEKFIYFWLGNTIVELSLFIIIWDSLLIKIYLTIWECPTGSSYCLLSLFLSSILLLPIYGKWRLLGKLKSTKLGWRDFSVSISATLEPTLISPLSIINVRGTSKWSSNFPTTSPFFMRIRLGNRLTQCPRRSLEFV